MKRFLVGVLQWSTAFGLIYGAWAWFLVPHSSAIFIASPELVWARLNEWARDGSAVTIVWKSVSEALAGLGIGAMVGIVAALMVVFAPVLVGQIVEPAVVAVYAMPKFALIPLIFLWLGSGFVPVTAFVGVSVFAIMFISTMTGLRTVDPDLVRMMELLGANRLQIASKLLIRHAMGYAVTGLTFAAPFALVVAIGAEMLLGTSDGLGGTLETAAELYEAPTVFAALILATLVAGVMIVGATAAGRRLSWTQETADA